MKVAYKSYSVVVAVAIIASFGRPAWCQSCGTEAYGGSPSVDFYATTPEKLPHTPDMMGIDKAVSVLPGSNVTLVCTAKMPLGFPPYLRSYLEPNLIKLFVNYSFIREFNCDKKPRIVKTCSLSLVNVKPGDKGKYFCQAVNELGCTYKQLKVAVTSGEREGQMLDILHRRKNISSKIKRNLK
ncbi:uncharacterized protein LOC111320800 isoform X2 [Stylophora pistillata]|uniref:Ig-like domain-containing protein n=1 Tax=Stylophora pistillata TaxID=50429 RepID=A0A2B4SRD3_STYPI|nr:uncharacterized protein LOC111320800 isoform X2 [Stylophora pistillata]PFX32451.1 hypothetical protein AWC38_SpisGene2697 [Stylophora pistillata]